MVLSLFPLCFLILLQVEFVISYNGRGELVAATVNITLTSVNLGELLLQTHSVQFKVAEQAHRLSTNELQNHKTSSTVSPVQLVAAKQAAKALPPTTGLDVGSPLLGHFNEEVKPVSSVSLTQTQTNLKACEQFKLSERYSTVNKEY